MALQAALIVLTEFQRDYESGILDSGKTIFYPDNLLLPDGTTICHKWYDFSSEILSMISKHVGDKYDVTWIRPHDGDLTSSFIQFTPCGISHDISYGAPVVYGVPLIADRGTKHTLASRPSDETFGALMQASKWTANVEMIQYRIGEISIKLIDTRDAYDHAKSVLSDKDRIEQTVNIEKIKITIDHIMIWGKLSKNKEIVEAVAQANDVLCNVLAKPYDPELIRNVNIFMSNTLELLCKKKLANMPLLAERVEAVSIETRCRMIKSAQNHVNFMKKRVEKLENKMAILSASLQDATREAVDSRSLARSLWLSS